MRYLSVCCAFLFGHGVCVAGGPYHGHASGYYPQVNYLGPAYNPSYYDSTAAELAQLSQQVQQLTFAVQTLLSVRSMDVPQRGVAGAPPGPGSGEDQVTVTLRNHGCAECHSREREPQGNFVLFEQGRLARQVDWAAVVIKVESGEMPKGGHKPITAAAEKKAIRQRWLASRRPPNH